MMTESTHYKEHIKIAVEVKEVYMNHPMYMRFG
jgi:hypothetical protein